MKQKEQSVPFSWGTGCFVPETGVKYQKMHKMIQETEQFAD